MNTLTCPGARGRAKTFRGYETISLAALKAVAGLPLDLYLESEGSDSPILYASDDSPPAAEDLARLEANGVHTLLIPARCRQLYNKHLQENLPAILECESIEPLERFELLRTAIDENCGPLFDVGQTEQVVHLATRVSGQVSQLLMRPEVTPRKVFDLLSHDFCTFSHSLNVACYCTLLAQGLSITDEQDLKAISLGGLLHDLGKRRIDNRILGKKGRLNDEEKEAIRRHPQLGYEELLLCEGISHGQLMMAYQHHERVDGNGYPVRILGPEIHSWARICSVVDVFDALTGVRPYRSRQTIPIALDVLEQNANTHFEEEMVRCWTSMIRER